MKTETEAGKAVKWVAPKPPYIGYKFTHHRLGNVKVIAIHPLGTIDVENIGKHRVLDFFYFRGRLHA